VTRPSSSIGIYFRQRSYDETADIRARFNQVAALRGYHNTSRGGRGGSAAQLMEAIANGDQIVVPADTLEALIRKAHPRLKPHDEDIRALAAELGLLDVNGTLLPQRTSKEQRRELTPDRTEHS